MVLALNARTGEQAWSLEIDGDIFSSPCIAKDIIIIGSMNKHLLAIDMSGNLENGHLKPKEKFGLRPLLMEIIFVGSDDGFLYCLNLDGKLQWRTKLNGKIRSSSPCLSDANTMISIGTHNAYNVLLEPV